MVHPAFLPFREYYLYIFFKYEYSCCHVSASGRHLMEKTSAKIMMGALLCVFLLLSVCFLVYAEDTTEVAETNVLPAVPEKDKGYEKGFHGTLGAGLFVGQSMVGHRHAVVFLFPFISAIASISVPVYGLRIELPRPGRPTAVFTRDGLETVSTTAPLCWTAIGHSVFLESVGGFDIF